jgi:hypothetical protein
VVAIALLAAACSGGTTSASSTTVAAASGTSFSPPLTEVQGCTYTVNGKISPYLPTGVSPHVAPFSADPSATSAFQSIRRRGGTGAVFSFTLPGRTELRSGPSTSAPVVLTVPATDQVEAYDPVLWTDASHHRWLGFFLACGGKVPYWAGLQDLRRTSPSTATATASLLATLASAAPYTTTGKESTLPIVVGPSGVLLWKDPRVQFSVGRGEMTVAV